MNALMTVAILMLPAQAFVYRAAQAQAAAEANAGSQEKLKKRQVVELRKSIERKHQRDAALAERQRQLARKAAGIRILPGHPDNSAAGAAAQFNTKFFRDQARKHRREEAEK